MQRLAAPRAGPIARVRRLLSRSRALLHLIQTRRAAREEDAYVHLREQYVRRLPDWAPPLAPAHAAAPPRRGAGQRTRRRGDPLRIFVVIGELETTVRLSDELARSFDTTVFDYVRFYPPSRQLSEPPWRIRLQDELLRSFRSGHDAKPFDLALLYVSHQECTRETLMAIRDSGVPVAVMCGDDKHSFLERPGHPNGQKPLIGAATVHLTNSLECMRWYEAEGVPAYYFPWAADPELYPHLDLPKDIPVSFVGGWYGARRDLITRLRGCGIDVRCWGPGTENGPVSRAAMVEIFNRSQVNLGFGGVGHATTVTHVKGRDFEVPMTGNLYLTAYEHELTRLFTIGEEILCYANWVDCAEQIRHWLHREEAARRVGRAARERSMRDHTWTRRITDLAAWLGILDQAGG